MDCPNAMIQVPSSQVTQQLRDFFDPSAPASLRCFAVLDGQAAGQVWADRLPSPNAAIVREAAFGSLYFGGAPDVTTIGDLISSCKKLGDVLIGLWPDDNLWQKLPLDPDYVGTVLEFNHRMNDETLHLLPKHMPEEYQLRFLDRELFKCSMMANYFTSVYGSVEMALKRGIGLCLMRDEEIMSEGSAGPSTNGLIEIGVETRQQYQRQGYATWVCAHLITECERLGFRTYWNCDAQNPASIALARKLGYHTGKAYKLVAWLK
jgi:RimJ/RimL family protein N-acetyltransferase